MGAVLGQHTQISLLQQFALSYLIYSVACHFSTVSSFFLFHNITYPVLSSSVFHMSPHSPLDDLPVWKLNTQSKAIFASTSAVTSM